MTVQRQKYKQTQLRVLTFSIDEQAFVMDVSLFQEILAPQGLQPMVGAPDYVVGVLSRRDRLIPVVDTAYLLGIRPALPPAQRAQAAVDEGVILILRLSTGLAGLLVSAASDLMWIHPQDFEVPSSLLLPDPLGIRAAAIQGVGRIQDRLFLFLNPEGIFADLGPLLPVDPSSGSGGGDSQDHRGEVETLFSGQVDQAELALAQEQARLRTTLHSLVAFELGDELYGFDALQVAEIRECLPIMPLPNVADFVLGLSNLRGTVLPVMDLRRRFQLAEQAPGPENRMVILRGDQGLVCILVDRVVGLVRLTWASFQAAPAGVAQIDPELYAQVAMVDGRMLVELDAQRLLGLLAAKAGSPQ